MCQLNLYLVPSNIPVKTVLAVLNNAFSFNCAEDVTDEFTRLYKQTSCNIYTAAGMRCNCGSVISFLQNEDSSASFKESINKSKSKEIEQLKKIRELLSSKDYEKSYNEYAEKHEELSNKVSLMTRHIGEYEIKAMGELKSLSKEKRDVARQQIYKNVAEMFQTVETDGDYKAALKELSDFSSENNLMLMSAIYCLDASREGSLNLNIDEAINNAISNDGDSYKEEFFTIQSVVDELLKISGEIQLAAFWQSGEDIEFESADLVQQKDLSIDILSFLPYGKLLKIIK